MTRRFWWIAAAAVFLASDWSGVRAGDGPAESCCKACCKKGCCGSGDEKTVTVKTPVVIFRGNATFASLPPCVCCPLPQPGGPVPPPQVMQCPTACPVMGCPMACPGMPVPPPPMSARAQDGRGYRVRVKTVEVCPGEEDVVTSCPVMMVPEGARFSVCFDNEAVLGKCGRTRSVEYPVCPAACSCQPGKSGGVVQVQIFSGRPDGRVHLELDVQQTECEKSGKEGVEVLCKCLHVVRPVTIGKMARVVLDRGPDGAARRWLEVTVKDREKTASGPVRQASSPELLPAPKKEDCDDGCFGTALGEFAVDVLSKCCECLGLYRGWSTGMTLPSPRYLQHPPQYVPPSPAFPLTRELATQELINAAPAPCVCVPGGCLPPSVPGAPGVLPPPVSCPSEPVMRCNQPSAWGTAIQTCAATAPVRTPPTVHIAVIDGEPRLEIACDGLRMACRKFDLKLVDKEPMTLTAVEGQVSLKGPLMHARANAVTTDQKDLLVLEGRVKVHYTSEGQTAEVTADRIEVNLADGSLKIKP